MALGATDLSGDLLPELYVANDFGPDRLFSNRSTPGEVRLVAVKGRRDVFTPRSKVLGRDAFKGMGVDFADLNGDGLLDIQVSNITTEHGQHEAHFTFLSTGEPELLERGRAPFVERGEQLGLARSGWAWDARFGDFDNDGRVELVQATGFLKGTVDRWPEIHETAMGNDRLIADPRAWHRFAQGDDLSGNQADAFWVRTRSGRFEDLAEEVGLGREQVTRGVASADVDGDGRLDLALALQWEAPIFVRNVAPDPGAFLGLHLRLPIDSGRDAFESRRGHPTLHERTLPALGAEARVHAPGGLLVAQVDGGNGHSGQRSHDLHFGLGSAPGFEPSVAQSVVSVATAASVELLLEWIGARQSGRRPGYAGGARRLVAFLLPAHITGLAVGMLLYPGDRLLPIVFASATAVASKSIFRASLSGRSRHYLNPSNFGIALTLVLFPAVGIAPGYMFTAELGALGDCLLPAVMIASGSLLNARFTGRFPLLAAWVAGFVVQALLRHLFLDASLSAALMPMTGVAFLLFSFYMVTDPATTPTARGGQVVFGLSVAAAYGLLMSAHIVFGLFFALAFVTLGRGALLHASALMERRARRPVTSSPMPALFPPRAIVRSSPSTLSEI